MAEGRAGNFSRARSDSSCLDKLSPRWQFRDIGPAKDACERDNLLIGKIPFSSFIA
jgi:hypothetical protein